MDVPVDEKTGGIAVQQIAEALEAHMRKVLSVIEMPGRGMRQEDIKAFSAPEREEKPPDPPVHLPLRILVCARFVAHGAAQPQDAHPLIFIDPSVDADAAFRRVSS